MGVHVVNALSSRLVAVVKKVDTIYYEVFRKGVPSGVLEKVKRSEYTSQPELKGIEIKMDEPNGLLIAFEADPEIFGESKYSYETLLSRMRDLAFLNPKVTIEIEDRRSGKSEVLSYKGGLVEFVKYLVEGYSHVNKDVIYNSREKDDAQIEYAFQYTTNTSETLESFVNNISTIEGGTHATGFRAGLSRAIQDYAKTKNF